jgi:oxygen-independent coproporphyrinogen III oxidase
MSLDRLALAESRVPRYTSYPTAAQFSPRVGAAQTRRWLNAVDLGRSASLYVHIPFCRQLCWYCGCNTTVVSRDAPIRRYLDHLHREITLVAAELPGRLPIAHLHFGGGTPTILDADAFTALMTAIRGAFDLLPDAEIAVEIDPRGLDDARIAALVAAGVTRVSLGIQDLDADVQEAINRVQPLELVQGIVAKLRAAGLRRISMDLIYGLPRQTASTLARTVADVAAMEPDRVSLFGYAHVPWMKAHQRLLEPSGLPGVAERLELSDVATAALLAAGYEAIGIDHFARPDDDLARAARDAALHRNFQGYTTDDAPVLIGLGASAISTYAEGFAQNATRTDDWAAAIARGELPTARGVAIDADDRRRAAIIERIMCTFRADLRDAVAEDASLLDDLDRLAPLEASGLVVRDGTRLTIPDDARPFARIVAATFDVHLRAAATRHSAAV